MKTRRSFLKRLTASAILGWLIYSPVRAVNKNKKMTNVLIHHVFFWLKNPESAEETGQFEMALKKLATIDVIRDSHIGVPASTEERDVVDHSYSFSLMLVFDGKKDQDIYQKHPVHLEFVKNNEHLWQKVLVYDSVDAIQD